jgi:hypothetical protein
VHYLPEFHIITINDSYKIIQNNWFPETGTLNYVTTLYISLIIKQLSACFFFFVANLCQNF